MKKKTAYFVAAMMGKEEYGQYYQQAADIIKEYGYTVYDDVNNYSIEFILNRSDRDTEKYWKLSAMKNIYNSDIFVADITKSSTSIGVEMGLAISDYKPTLLLRHESVKSHLPVPLIAMNSKVTVIDYSEENMSIQIVKWLKKVEEGEVTKFMNVGFTKKQISFIEYLQKRERIKSFALALRLILDGKFNMQDELDLFEKDNDID
jgi:hypothetical protein